jgi:hypothetical protein
VRAGRVTVGRRWSDRDVRPQLFEPRLRNSFDRQQVFDALEWAAALAKLDDRLFGPMPGSCSSCSIVAVLMLTGVADGFF